MTIKECTKVLKGIEDRTDWVDRVCPEGRKHPALKEAYERGDKEKEAIQFALQIIKVKKENVVCPFCSEDDFDLVGLKYHLARYCEEFNKTDNI